MPLARYETGRSVVRCSELRNKWFSLPLRSVSQRFWLQGRDDVPTLCAKSGESYKPKENAIPLWGELVIYDSPADALERLEEHPDDTKLDFVRVVLVADAVLLGRMCKHGSEVLSSTEAGLYLEVHPSCPAYFARWNEDPKITTHDVQNSLDRRWSTIFLIPGEVDLSWSILV